MIHVATITKNEVNRAIALEWNDFEDSIQHTVGESINAQYIITRNPKDYEASTIKRQKIFAPWRAPRCL
ncbi:hypothetical protein FACS189461_5110 [Spirochaetia bacterium]|nr:hypothetical protein FACS189461_5110 [Spirochaetia bacterium]